MTEGYQAAYQIISLFAVLLLVAPGAILSLLVCVKVFDSARFTVAEILRDVVHK